MHIAAFPNEGVSFEFIALRGQPHPCQVHSHHRWDVPVLPARAHPPLFLRGA